MNRVLRRPMFKMGGSAGTGITSGLDKPRQNYQDAGSVNPLSQYPTDFFPQLGTREIKQDTPNVTMDTSAFSPGAELLKAFENRNTRPDLSRFLIDFGLDFASRSPTGKGLSGLISTAAASAKEPAKTMFERKEADDAFRRKLKLAATQMDIDKKLKEEFAEKKFGRDLALALAKPQKVSLKQVRNTSNQTLFGIEPGKTGFVTPEQILSAKGVFAPIDNRMSFTYDSKTGTLTQLPLSEVEKIEDNKETARAIGTQYNILTALTKDMQERLPGTTTGFTGNFFQFLEGAADQFRQLGSSYGIANGLTEDFDESKIDAYLESKGATKLASNFATMKGSVINLGYALAKIAEPDNPRLSEGDIIRQLNRINFGASRKVFKDSLDQILKEEGIRANAEIKGLKLKPEDFIGVKKTDSTTETDESGMDNYIFENGKLFQIINGKKVEVN